MVTGAVVLQVASGVRNLEQAKSIVNALPPTELSKRNRQALHQMRVPDPVTDRFLENRLLSPRHQTLIVEAMKTLSGVPGRSAFIQYAARADSEDAALLFQQMAELLAGYYRSVAPIQRLDIYQNVPVAYTGQGSAVILLPIDRLLWTDRTSGIAASLATDIAEAATGPKSRGLADRRRDGPCPAGAAATWHHPGRARRTTAAATRLSLGG
jgi:hypothetical protein